VMPHALFLGSSLASVDRLNMVPRPPSLRSRKSFRMPRMFSWPFPFSYPFSRSTSSRRQQDEDIGTSTSLELGVLPIRPSVDGDRDSIQPAPLPRVQRRGSDLEDKILGGDEEMSASATTTPRLGAGLGESSDALTKDFEAATREYEADLMAFDRIRWVDLHVLHATVSERERLPRGPDPRF
jgi:metal iron transporter